MSQGPIHPVRVLLNVTELNTDEKARETLVGTILAMAPNSALYAKNPALQQAVNTLSSTFATSKTADVTAATSKKQADQDAAAAVEARNAASRALELVRNIVEHDATSAEEAQSMAFEVRLGKQPLPPFLPPGSIDVKPGKPGSGSARASVHGIGKTKSDYAAEFSPNPVTPSSWVSLPGRGKSRKLSGESGAQLWVRFALIRGEKQTDWSTPVLITLP